jgi:hypothetical protein
VSEILSFNDLSLFWAACRSWMVSRLKVKNGGDVLPFPSDLVVTGIFGNYSFVLIYEISLDLCVG